MAIHYSMCIRKYATVMQNALLVYIVCIAFTIYLYYDMINSYYTFTVYMHSCMNVGIYMHAGPYCFIHACMYVWLMIHNRYCMYS